MTRTFSLFVCWLIFFQLAQGGVVELQPIKDATLYESTSDQLANGAGSVLIVGKTGRSSDSLRRALLQFDLTGLPVDATITNTELSLFVSRAPSSDVFPVDLHRVLMDWGEGPSDAEAVGDGQGIAAQPGDASWTHAFYPDTLWENVGGDFVSEPSASSWVGDADRYAWSSPQMLNDVRQWLTDPESNFGWLMIGDETKPRSAKRINSRSNVDLLTRPLLTIMFDPGASVIADCNGDGVLDAQDLSCVCASGAADLQSTLDELNLLAGDINGNGRVGFPDFLVLAANFGRDGDYDGGDLNCDGTVGFADFLVLAGNFGRSSQAQVSVPEPSTGGILRLCALLLCIWAFRRRSRIPLAQ